MRIVQKYGGSSLASLEKVRSAAQRISQLARQGAQVVVVVSAQGDTTDRLVAAAQAVMPHPAQRELDVCLASGEQVSAALMAMAIAEIGGKAISLTGWQAGLLTDRVHGNARVKGLASNRISGNWRLETLWWWRDSRA